MSMQYSVSNTINRLYSAFLSDTLKKRSEKLILTIAIIGFIIHLILIFLNDLSIIELNGDPDLFRNPIAAIYTPFSFILIYEVYLLIYYLPKSITTYISKQYEIITLIIIRRLFKDLANLELSSNWFQIKNDLQFTYDIIAAILLFLLLYLFHYFSKKKNSEGKSLSDLPVSVQKFVNFKRLLAVILVPSLLLLAGKSLVEWLVASVYSSSPLNSELKDINNIFFDEFFTILIIVDVLLLLLSFFHTDEFHKVIRNSGFIISTILIRLSFSVEGIVNTALIVFAVLFGLLIVIIHNLYEHKLEKLSDD